MTWFKADDGFYDHPKVLGLSMAARGLWITAGTWCAKHLTDGVIPARQVRALGGTPAQTRALIQHGLWFESEDDSGAKSYAFHGWNDMQPSRKEILESREREREKKREWRKRKDREQGKRENVPGGQDGGQDQGHFRPSRHPDPTRPDPTRPDHLVVTPCSPPEGDAPTAPTPTPKPPPKRGTRIPDGWSPGAALRSQMAAECPGVDLDYETRKFTDYWAGVTGQRGTKKDWDATWRNWIRRAGETTGTANRSQQPSHRHGYTAQEWLPEAPWDYVDGEVLDTKELT